MPTLKHVWQQLIQHGDYAFSIDLQDAYLHIPIVKHHCHCFLHFVWCNVPYQWKVYLLGLPQPLGFLHPSPNLFCSFAVHKGLHIVIYLDDILVLVCSKQSG